MAILGWPLDAPPFDSGNAQRQPCHSLPVTVHGLKPWKTRHLRAAARDFSSDSTTRLLKAPGKQGL
jgi:hypothetical protein